MSQNDYTPDRTPPPEQIAAWVDGESLPGEADLIEAWITFHPEARRDAESTAQITRLYRDQPVPFPSETRWNSMFDQIQPRIQPAAARRWRLLVGLTLASAALVGAVIFARSLWQVPAIEAPIARQTPTLPIDDDDDEPFAVARTSEVHIIRMDADDADRVVTGQPLIGTMDFAGQGDIDLHQVKADPVEGRTPGLERRAGLPWVVATKADEENEP